MHKLRHYNVHLLGASTKCRTVLMFRRSTAKKRCYNVKINWFVTEFNFNVLSDRVEFLVLQSPIEMSNKVYLQQTEAIKIHLAQQTRRSSTNKLIDPLSWKRNICIGEYKSAGWINFSTNAAFRYFKVFFLGDSTEWFSITVVAIS